MVGWYVPPTGSARALNHAQLFLEGPQPMMLDPTLGIMADGSYDQVASGQAVEVRDLSWRNEIREIEDYRDRVVDALSEGALRPSHVLYWMADYAAYRVSPRTSGWQTAAACRLDNSGRPVMPIEPSRHP